MAPASERSAYSRDHENVTPSRGVWASEHTTASARESADKNSLISGKARPLGALAFNGLDLPLADLPGIEYAHDDDGATVQKGGLRRIAGPP
jgi:hypothetical protein